MPNPNVPQGNLNRLIASMNFAGHPELNITPSYLGRGGIRITFNGRITENLPTMVGVVPSPEPYIAFTATLELVRSQGFADTWKQTYENNSYLGDSTVWPDSTTLSPFNLQNASITGVRDLPINGTDPTFAVTIEGSYAVNQGLYPG